MKTRMTELLNIEYPIFCGGMFRVGRAPLVAAVSEAGGLGFLTSAHYETAEALRAEIRRAKQLTKKPIGVNITLSPRRLALPNEAYIEVLIEEGVRVVETAGRNPEKYLPTLKEHGVTVIHKVPSVRYAKKAEQLGVDAVAIVGIEGGGHPGEGDIGSFVLIPKTVDSVSIPVIAGGGIADGRGLAAALALGADGVLMGTRFMAAKESLLHDNVKRWMVEAKESDSMLIQRTIGSTHRVAKNDVALQVLEAERRGASIDELYPLITGKRTEKVFYEGDVNAGVWSCGASVGLIDGVLSAKEVIERMVSEAKLAMKQAANRLEALNR